MTADRGSGSAPFYRYAEIAERLLDNGYAPLPVTPGSKAVLLRNWQQHCQRLPSLETVTRWAARFPDHGTGAATGCLIGIDIDFLDSAKAEQTASVARNILGDTPLVRIGQAPKTMRFYRTTEPFATMKADGVEVLSLGRQAVLYHIHPDTGRPYIWVDESPLDVPLSALPIVTEDQCRRWFLTVTGAGNGIPERPAETGLLLADKGFRHDTLFPLVRKAGMLAATLDDLLGEARRLNAAVCTEPLPDAQIQAMTRGVWRYREQGTLWTENGEARALVSANEFVALADEPDAVALLILLRLSHGTREEPFALVADAMTAAELLGDWGPKYYMRNRDILLERGFLELVRRGMGRGNPSLYRLGVWSEKGAAAAVNININTASLLIERTRTLVQVRYQPGIVTVTTETETERLLFDPVALPHVLTPAEALRQQVRGWCRTGGRGAQSRLAESLGLSRHAVANFLAGRYPLNATAEAMLRTLTVTPPNGGAP